MATVKEMIADIIRKEGGFVNNPSDHGGATNYGVSLTYVKGVGINPTIDVNGDGVVDARDTLDLDHNGYLDWHDIALVTPQLAARLYEIDFYERPGIDKLNPVVQPVEFDSAVNHGPGKAIMFLQRALVTGGFLPRYNAQGRRQDDGVLGPASKDAAARACTSEQSARDLNNRIVDARLQEYQMIVAGDASQGQFLGGWTTRAKSFYLR